MKWLCTILLLLPVLSQSQVSYWFQGFQRQGNAQYAQQYFFLAGSNVVITYTNPYVYINSTGTNVVLPNVYATNVINPPWQIGCPNLTNWCQIQTNVLGNYQPLCANLTAWCANNPATYTNGLGGGGSPQTNISYTAVTNAPWQWGCDNLTNWCLFPTNILGTIATNATNFTLTASNNIWVNIGTSNFITAATSGVQTNWTNIWTGTNTFNADLYAVRSLTVGTNVNTASTNSIRFRNGNGANWIMAQNSFTTLGYGANGLAWRTLADGMSVPDQLEIHGAPLVLNCASTDPMYFYNNGAEAATIAGKSLRVGPAPIFFGAGEQAYIACTNLFYTPRYGRLNSGLVIATNSWNLSGLGSFAVGDTFQNGDMLIANSNSIPYAICKNTNGVVSTNLMLHVAEATTNDWHTAGNIGMGAPGGIFGTLDNSPVTFKINNVAFGRMDSVPTLALGVSSSAVQANDLALGPTAIANGTGATAVGFAASATALSATALGYGARATGQGGVAIGFNSLANSIYSFSVGNGAGAGGTGNYSVNVGKDTITGGLSAVAIGDTAFGGGDYSFAAGRSAAAINQGSFVWSDSTAAVYTDTAANQFVVYASGGIDLHSAGAGTKTDGPLQVETTTWSTNGYYYSAVTNGVAPPPVVLQPLHTWASMMMTNTNTFNFGAGTYGAVTNYSVVRTNQMFANKAHGCVTNTVAGYYYCAIHMSAKALDPSAFVEGDILLNGVARDEISFQSQFDNPARYKGMSAFGILYVTNNTQITFQLKSSGASGVEVSRAQLVVMPP